MTSFSDSMTSLVTPFDSEFNSLSIGVGHVAMTWLFSTFPFLAEIEKNIFPFVPEIFENRLK